MRFLTKKTLNAKQAAMLFLCLTLPALIYVIYWCAQLWAFTVDDAYITLRYAENFANSGKLLWNLNMPPAEGYTSVLHVSIIALSILAHCPPLLTAKLIGVFAMVGIFIAVIFRAIQIKEWQNTLFLALLFSFLAWNVSTAVHMVAGLETMQSLFLLSLLFVLYFYLCHATANHINKKLMVSFGFIALLCGLTRPENNLYALTLFGFLALHLRNKQRKQLLLYGMLIYVLPGVFYFAWRLWYFHILFPLPFYTKAVNSTALGLKPTGLFLLVESPLILVIGTLYYFILKQKKSFGDHYTV